MACRKTVSTPPLRRVCDYDDGDIAKYGDQIQAYVTIGNVHGIKEHPVWSRRVDYKEHTCFLLPADVEVSNFVREYTLRGTPNIKATDFAQFWLSLDDLHKERRLLVAYLCTIRGIKAEFGPRSNLEIDVLCDMVTGYLWTVRRLFITEQNKKGGKKLKEMAIRFLNQFVNTSHVEFFGSRLLENFFLEDFRTAMQRTIILGPCGVDMVIEISAKFFMHLFTSLAAVYLYWALFDMSKAEEYCGAKWQLLLHALLSGVPPGQGHEAAQRHYLRKLRVAIPHWRMKDKAYILQTMQAKEKSCKQCYVERLLSYVGPDQFKLIAFGKEKFCSNCGRSSYVLEDRLWSCDLCVKEKVRPKARYCNVGCQKAHWLKHKSEVHAYPSCSHCGRKMVPLRVCKRCREENVRNVARYCSVPCQQIDWPMHKRQAHSGKK